MLIKIKDSINLYMILSRTISFLTQNSEQSLFISSIILSSLLSIIAIFITAYAFDMLSEIIYIISSSSVLFSIQTLLFSPFFILISLVVFTIKLIFILAKKKELR